MSSKCVAAFAKAARKYKDLETAFGIDLDRGSRVPLFEANLLAGIPEERQRAHAITPLNRMERRIVGVHDHVRAVGRIELPKFHEERAARRRTGRVTGLRWVANIGPRGKIAVFVLEYAFEHKKFLAAAVHVRL